MPTINRTTLRFHDAAGKRLRRVGIYTGPSSYATGGDAFVAKDVSLGVLEHISFGVAHDGLGTFRLLVYDHANGKVIWVVPNTGAEVAAATNLSAFTARFEAMGM